MQILSTRSSFDSLIIYLVLTLHPENVFFSIEQAGLFKQLLTNSNEVEAHFREAEAALLDAQKQIQIALVAAGISGQDIIGGNLDGENPYFTIKNGNGIIKE